MTTHTIQSLLEKELVGKSFIYPSPYGGITKGVINQIHITYRSLIHPDKLEDYNKKNKYERSFNRHQYTVGYRPEINIVSTTGVSYHFNEIYLEHAPAKDTTKEGE